MKIGFSGASGSGKTTLVNEIYKRLLRNRFDVYFVKEVARDVFKDFSEKYGFKNLFEIRNSDFHIRFQKEVLDRQIKLEREAMKQHDIVLTDRTIYDVFMYLFLRGDFNQIAIFSNYFQQRIRTHKPYNMIFVTEYLENENIDDGFRTYDLNDRIIQESILIALLKDKNWLFVPKAPINHRVSIVLKKIEEVRNSEYL